jgi:hypothetical protein
LTWWYDMGEDYTVVGSLRLEQLADWMSSPDRSASNLPDGRWPWARRAAEATWSRCQQGGFGRYFADTVRRIAADHPNGTGNTWRLLGQLGLDLTNPGQEPRRPFQTLRSGRYAPVKFKRAWMLLMFLRRDEGIIRCLVERALSMIEGGRDALRYWYDERSFPPSECHLPVDKRILTIAAELFQLVAPNEIEVMRHAHAWGQQHRLPSSMLDALFFAMDVTNGSVRGACIC